MLKFSVMMVMMFLLPLGNSSYMFVSVAGMYFIISWLGMTLYPMGGNEKVVSNFFFFFDGLSIPLIMLSLWVIGLMVMSSYKIFLIEDNSIFFIYNVLILSVVLVMCFSVSSLIMFYVLFESSLIPTMAMILIWGYQPERLQASLYFMMYTIMASLPLLIGLMMIWGNNFSFSMILMVWVLPVVKGMMSLWWLMIMMAFLVKMPLYTFHLWLPKAHVEAPVAGSMILAAILLKLGSYGIMRVMLLFPEISLKLIPMMSSLSMIGACVTSIICLRQPDMKSMIAYSSVGHMGFVIIGVLSYSMWGWCGALSLMIAHGLCSSGLFSIANMVYEYIGSRSLLLVKGMLSIFPCMAIWWFLLLIANMSAPPSLNLFSEILLLVSILKSSLFYSVLFLVSSFMVGSFSLMVYVLVQHGTLSNFLNPFNYSFSRNSMLMVLHIVPLYMLLVAPSVFYLMY